jgi:hypothetical protein
MLDMLTSEWSGLFGGTPRDKLSEELSTRKFGRCGEVFRRGEKPLQRCFKARFEQESPLLYSLSQILIILE